MLLLFVCLSVSHMRFLHQFAIVDELPIHCFAYQCDADLTWILNQLRELASLWIITITSAQYVHAHSERNYSIKIAVAVSYFMCGCSKWFFSNPIVQSFWKKIIAFIFLDLLALHFCYVLSDTFKDSTNITHRHITRRQTCSDRDDVSGRGRRDNEQVRADMTSRFHVAACTVKARSRLS